jgi:HemY protein
MKTLFKFLIIALIAVAAGLLAHQDAGYVLFGRGTKTMEMSLSLFLTLFLFSYLFAYVLLRFIIRSWEMPEQLKRWRREKQAKKARKVSLQGLINLSQGQWKKAERMLLGGVKHSDMPLLNYLSAAKAAQKQNAPDRRDHYLAMAHESMPEADFSVKLTQAELQFAHGQNEQALATLVHLHNLSPKHPHIMSLLSRLYFKLKSWDDLKVLLPQLRKEKVLPEKEIFNLERDTYIELINRLHGENKFNELQSLWQDISGDLKKDLYVQTVYCKKLINLNKHDDAERLLREILRKAWQPALIELYGLVKSSAPEKQLSFAESLLKDHENNPALLLTLGRLCMHNDLWGKARSYLEASLGNKEKPETYKELGLLMEYLNEGKLAADYFRKGLLLASNTSSY